jgi:hypothetical protein
VGPDWPEVDIAGLSRGSMRMGCPVLVVVAVRIRDGNPIREEGHQKRAKSVQIFQLISIDFRLCSSLSMALIL